MKKSKATKRTLLLSVLAMLLCMVMLVGTTFAWFTDSASTAVNTIQAGTLDIALEMKDASGNWVTAEGQTLSFKKAEGSEEILWEPGATYALPAIKIVNKGNLWLKYKVEIAEGITKNASNGESNVSLLNVIDFYVIEGEVEEMPALGDAKTLAEYFAQSEATDGNPHPGTPLAPSGSDGSSSKLLTIVGHMQEDAGNEYQGLKLDSVAITVLATQHTEEYDSFNNTYDANAVYSVSVKNQDDLDNALNSDGAVKITIEKDAEVAINNVDFVGKNAGTTVANYGTLTVSGSTVYSTDAEAQGRHAITNYGTLTVENSTLGSPQSRGNAIRNFGTATIKNSTLTCCDNYLNGGFAYVFANSAGTMTIDDCNYTGKANGVFAADGGNIIINSGTYKLTGDKSFYMFYMAEGTITVNGGTFEKSGNTYGMAYATDGSINDQLTINGGTFTYNGAEWGLS